MIDTKFKSFIISLLRRGTFRWKPREEARKRSRNGQILSRGRMIWVHTCAVCKKDYKASQIVVDHINPVVDPELGFQGWDVYIPRMFCDVNNFQVLCETCHDAKTSVERDQRKQVRKRKKDLTQV